MQTDSITLIVIESVRVEWWFREEIMDDYILLDTVDTPLYVVYVLVIGTTCCVYPGQHHRSV